jgi:hypothetical protein
LSIRQLSERSRPLGVRNWVLLMVRLWPSAEARKKIAEMEIRTYQRTTIMFNLLPTKQTLRQVRKKMAAVVVTPQRVTTIRVAKAALRKPVSDRILAQRADRRQPIRGVV